MKNILLITSVIGVLFSLISCVSTREPTYHARTPETDESNVPWNRPQAGDNSGALGGLLNRDQ